MTLAKTDGKLLETPPSIDIEGLVNRLREQAEKKSPETPQGEALLGPDPAAGALAKQGDLNHGLVTAIGAMFEHLQKLGDHCADLEGKLTRQSQQEQALSKRIESSEGRLEALEHKIETRPATPANVGEEFATEIKEIRQRLGQQSAMAEGRDQLAYRQMAKIKREAEKKVARITCALEESRRELEDAKRRWQGSENQVRQVAVELEQIKARLYDRGTLLANSEQMRRERDDAAHQSAALAVQVESLCAAVEKLKGGMAELDARSIEIESEVVQHATWESSQIKEQDRRIETIREELTCELNALDDLEKRLPQPMGEGTGSNLPNQLDGLRMRVLRNERKLCRLSPGSARPVIQPSDRLTGLVTKNGEEKRSNGHNGNHREEPLFDYFAYQLELRGSRAEIKRRQSAYLDLFKGCKNVLDLGCGRGEFVELLEESGIPVIGVDDSEDMAEFCQDRGLAVVCENMFDYMRRLPNENVDGIMLSQIVEHLPPDSISELLGLCAAKLQPGGIIVIESVNTLCPGVLGSFYMDPTHVRPVPARLLAFVAEQAGLKVQSIRFSQPVPEHAASPMLETSAELAPGADQYQDYAVVGRKP